MKGHTAMKVKDLIKYLETLDQNLEVLRENPVGVREPITQRDFYVDDDVFDKQGNIQKALVFPEN
jgi:hypothetical protein